MSSDCSHLSYLSYTQSFVKGLTQCLSVNTVTSPLPLHILQECPLYDKIIRHSITVASCMTSQEMIAIMSPTSWCSLLVQRLTDLFALSFGKFYLHCFKISVAHVQPVLFRILNLIFTVFLLYIFYSLNETTLQFDTSSVSLNCILDIL